MKTWFNFLAAIMLTTLLFSCKKNDVAGNKNPAEVQRPDFAYGVKAANILDMVNQVRRSGCKCGDTDMPPVGELTWNDLLAQAAYWHSEDMKTNDFFDHAGSDKSKAGDRIKSAGYDWFAYGENIALGQPTETVVMNSWLQSEGHCKNIMNANFKEMGIGRVDNYWTQEFAAKNK